MTFSLALIKVRVNIQTGSHNQTRSNKVQFSSVQKPVGLVGDQWSPAAEQPTSQFSLDSLQEVPEGK